MIHRPNILLIVAERIRYDCIGSSRMRLSKTPYIDWLAGNGVWFEGAYTPHPNFGLAQSVLLSGVRANANAFFPQNPHTETGLPQLNQTNWSRKLRDDNWLCSWFGDWQVVGRQADEFGYELHAQPETTDPREQAQAAVSWLHRYGQQGLPWHLCLSFADTLPEAQPERTDSNGNVPLAPWPNFTDDLQDKPMAQRRLQQRNNLNHNLWSDWSERAANSVHQASRLDEAVGVMVSQINQMGLLEDTLIVFTAASGSMCGSHRLVGNEYACYEEIMHVPMLLHWPGVIPAGLRCDQLVSSLLDLPATLSALINEQVPAQFQGVDLSCIWSDKNDPLSTCRREGVLSSQLGLSNGLYTQRMYRDQRYKYVWNPTDLDELYDLEKDPYELINRIGKEKDQVGRLRGCMLAEMQRCSDPLALILALETGANTE